MLGGEAKLILVRHSLPDIDYSVPAGEWRLSDEGRSRCRPLAARIEPYGPTAIISSLEAKAVETAELLGRHLKLPVRSAPGLHEHERPKVGYMQNETFAQAVATFFAQPDALTFGQETARQARERFEQALTAVLNRRPRSNACRCQPWHRD